MGTKVSVIIPAYNVEQYIFQCVDSVLTQTYQDFEILITNDGSSDNTYEYMKTLQFMDSRIRIFTSENKGQGYQRNRMVEQAQGDYILFLDADDYLEPRTLELAVKRITEDESDLVFFDFKYFFEKTGKLVYKNKEMFFGRKMLKGKDCLLLLSISPYFSVNRLYSKEFLQKNNIHYGEGYLYEDNPFIVSTAFYAKRISILHSPLYVVRKNETSSTNTNTNTDVHCYGFLKSVETCKNILQQTPYKNHYYYYRYALERYFLYVRTRIPKKLIKQFTKDFLELLSDVDIKLVSKKDKRMNICVKQKIFKKKKYLRFKLLRDYFIKVRPRLKRIALFALRQKTKFFNRLKKRKNKTVLPHQSQDYLQYLNAPIKENTVLFMGFDYRYTGNYRYLFELMAKNPCGKTLYFATSNKLVDSQYRIEPYTKEFYKLVATAKVVVFESWTPSAFHKRPDTTWVQLWHGTPLKKMLFDSEETEIITKKDAHKINKYIDIQKWDYLVTDSPNINPYFETSFLATKKQLLPCGYPRVKYLVDNKENQKLKAQIKEKYNISTTKKIVVYLPTWRDYNYGKTKDIDNNYLLDTKAFQEKLGEGYLVIDKNHSFLNTAPTANQDMETQELLLIADYLVTDYSSVLYDAFAIDLPVAIYCNDFEKYQKSRGVYPELWEDLKPFVSEDLDSLCNMIARYPRGEAYDRVKEFYCFKDNVAQLTTAIHNALASGNGKKRAMAILPVDSAINANQLHFLRKASQWGEELLVLLTGNHQELYAFVPELEQLPYVRGVVVQKETSLETLLQNNHVQTIVLEDTPENRTAYENKFGEYEMQFIK